MTTKSQEAFEAKYPALIFTKNALDTYVEEFTESCFCVWQAAEAYGRKQALEEAVEICKKECFLASDHQYDRGWANAAKRIVKDLQELMK
jgi:hypothetical protein